MGQQQLLLVILVTIIVGIATVVAINIFGTSAEQANQDAVRQDLAQIGTSAQGWYIRPDMLGGGGNSFEGITFRDITFPAESISEDGLTAHNINGTYVIQEGSSETQFLVRAYPSSDSSYGTAPSIAGAYFIGTVTRSNVAIGSLQAAAE
ncbi:MAG: hypothetical protein JJU35_14715 [Balneolales bacterium]|nr:hypothetical protein [Balneolales bacterium]